MLTSLLLRFLDVVFQMLRKNKLVMGGIQVVFVGDFCQLKIEKKYLFQDDIWPRFDFCVTLFTENIRQSKDLAFFEALEKIRYGRVDKHVVAMFSRNPGTLSNPLILNSTNEKVHEVNEKALSYMGSRATRYMGKLGENKSRFKSRMPLNVEDLFKELPVEYSLLLAPNAKVMLLVNDYKRDYSVYNGSRGRVISCQQETVIVHFELGDGNELELMIEPKSWFVNGQEVKQLPLKLCYGMTVHKCQGLTIKKNQDCGGVLLDMSDIFTPGIFLVGASRVERREDLQIEEFDITKILLDKEVVSFNRKILKEQVKLLDNPQALALMEKCEQMTQ
jgi:ATP-dependent DNA helicase PIF1